MEKEKEKEKEKKKKRYIEYIHDSHGIQQLQVMYQSQ